MANMKQFKSIESYPIVSTISVERLSVYNDYIKKAIEESQRMHMIARQTNQFFHFDGLAR